MPEVPRNDRGLCLKPKVIAAEWGAILLVVSVYCAALLRFDPQHWLPGNEAEVFQSLDWTLVNSLKDYGQFPLWNPYLRTGLPYVADPFLHVFQPLATMPVLILGVWNGFKVALYLSVLAAALGMWWMGAVLGVGPLSRLWMGLMYACTGQAAARFLQGQYDFVLRYAWIPWVLGSAMLALQTRRIKPALGTAGSLALLFFSGNVYYAFYMTLAMALLSAITLAGWDPAARRACLRYDRLPVIALITVLSLGLAAVQLLPLADFRGQYAKQGDPDLTGSHSLPQILQDLTSREKVRRDLIPNSPPEEHYAYTGIWPVLLLAFVPFAFRSGRRRNLLFLASFLLFALAWVAVRYTPWAGLYSRIAFLSQFRYQTRMNIYVVAALLGLAGCGLDALWRFVGTATSFRSRDPRAAIRPSRLALAAAPLILFCVWSVGDVFATNRKHVQTSEFYAPPYELMHWLRQQDKSAFYVSYPLGWHGAVISNGMRHLDAWYGFDPQPPLGRAFNRRPVRPGARYAAVGNDAAPDSADAELVKRFAQYRLYRLPSSLPFAFAVTREVLADPAEGRQLEASEVRELPPVLASPNRIEISAEGFPGEILTVLTSAYDGWILKLDGRAAELLNVGGFLATALQPGCHTYTFEYIPAPFYFGLLISLLSLVTLVGLAVTDMPWLYVLQYRLKRGSVRGGEILQGKKAPHVLQAAATQVDEGRASPALVAVSPEAGKPHGGGKAGWILFGGALFLYLFTRLQAIDRFPIYFFADEAIQAVYAQELLDSDFKDAAGKYFPLYFEAAGNRWTPLLSVYVYAIPIAMLGKGVTVTRAASVLVSLLGATAVALILKLAFRSRYWWAGALLMTVSPAWFLHSRTGFETVMMSSFFACTLFFYLLYRTRSPRYIFATILFAAATFYTYSNGQVIVATFAALILVSDLRYHLKNWRTLLPAILLVSVVAAPAVRFNLSWHTPVTAHLQAIDSYWFRDVPLTQKMMQFARTYAYGLSPAYWFVPNEHDLIRHRMKGYGHLNMWMAPLFLLGLGICLWRVRSPAHRAVLLAALSAPAGAALVDISITRVLVWTIPACVLAGLGLNAVMETLHGRLRMPSWVGAGALTALLGGAALWMLRDALIHGPLWYDDYGLYGMQYGAAQLFEREIPAYLSADTNTRILVSSTWANGADTFLRFFLSAPQQARVGMRSVDSYMKERQALDGNTVLVMTAPEYEQARASGKFQSIDVDRIIPYPDGRPGFYFARLAYAEDIDQKIEAERAARIRSVEEAIDVGGEVVQVSHSVFDIGQLQDLFDGDTFTLARGLEANPLVLEFGFARPRRLKGVRAVFGSMDFRLTASLTGPDQEVAEVYSRDFRGLPRDPDVEMEFARGPDLVARLRLEILKLDAGGDEHIHVREVVFR